MSEFRTGQMVVRKSYDADILFQVIGYLPDKNGQKVVLLKGLDVRLYADAPVSDLQKATRSQVNQYRKKFINSNNQLLSRLFQRRHLLKPDLYRSNRKESQEGEQTFFGISGRVLHIDGNEDYLRLCEEIYQQLGIEAVGVHVPETEQPDKVVGLLKKYQPDVLVLTGHDGFIKESKDFARLESYRNSKYFAEAVKNARRYRPNKDDLVIFAGACQSHYEVLLKAGANFASSPTRALIHAFDPVFIVERICSTSASQTVSANDIIENSITGIKGIGGIETRGKHRWGFPRSPY